ncbi:hypothetical protein ACLKA7_001035 [Drosophila subpalustris]
MGAAFALLEQKQQRIDESKSCLDMFTRNKSELLRRKGQTINSDYYGVIGAFERRNRKETASYGEEKSVVPTKTMHRVTNQ